MGKDTGFLEFSRQIHNYDKIEKRKKNFSEFTIPLSSEEIRKQGARCMDCGIPFCHQGCPLGNIIPDFNHFLYIGDIKSAFKALTDTNNFPDITGRICPAPCESACVLGINKPPVAIKSIEYAISDEGVKRNWLYKPVNNRKNSLSTKVAIIGSGPAGLACADQLSQIGHQVTVFERANEIGGLLTYGIPNFKLDKKLVKQHTERIRKQGVTFKTNTEVGKDIAITEIERNFDAIVLAVGSTVPRNLPISGSESIGIYQAIEFLTAATAEVLGHNKVPPHLSAKGREVLVIGGGDTGSDCIGTSIRQKAKNVIQIEILPQPPTVRDKTMPWPLYDHIFRVSSSQAEGCSRKFNILTKEFLQDKSGKVKGIKYVEVEWDKNKRSFKEKSNSKVLKANLILLAMGFVGVEKDFSEQWGLVVDQRGRITTHPGRDFAKLSQAHLANNNPDTLNLSGYFTSKEKVFAAGDARRGQSLVVWAISEGRECAREVDGFLKKQHTTLKSKNTMIYSQGYLD